jgi:hypothetical protein
MTRQKRQWYTRATPPFPLTHTHNTQVSNFRLKVKKPKLAVGCTRVHAYRSDVKITFHSQGCVVTLINSLRLIYLTQATHHPTP